MKCHMHVHKLFVRLQNLYKAHFHFISFSLLYIYTCGNYKDDEVQRKLDSKIKK